MNPVKPDEIYEKVAKSTGIEKSIVTFISKFYWKVVRSKLTSLYAPSLYITGLGRFSIKQYKVFNEIERLRSKVKYHRDKNPTGPVTIDYERDYKLLSDLGNRLKDEWERKKEYRNERK